VKKTLRKLCVRTVITLGVIAVVILLYVRHYTGKDHSATLRSYRTGYTSSEISLISSDTSGSVYNVLLHRGSRPVLRCYLRIPDAEGPLPVMVLLGGLHTGREAVHLVGETGLVRQFIFMTADYPYEGKTKHVSPLEFTLALPAIRDAVFDAAMSVSTMIDYLETREETDMDNIFLTGVSFGSFFVVPAGALDTRVKAVASLYGGGDIPALIAANIKGVPWILRKIAGELAGLILLPVEPLDYAHMIAPRHFLMVNGRDDEQIPRECVLKLFDRARQPKDIAWFETTHVHPTKSDITQELTTQVDAWISEKKLVR